MRFAGLVVLLGEFCKVCTVLQRGRDAVSQLLGGIDGSTHNLQLAELHRVGSSLLAEDFEGIVGVVRLAVVGTIDFTDRCGIQAVGNVGGECTLAQKHVRERNR